MIIPSNSWNTYIILVYVWPSLKGIKLRAPNASILIPAARRLDNQALSNMLLTQAPTSFLSPPDPKKKNLLYHIYRYIDRYPCYHVFSFI